MRKLAVIFIIFFMTAIPAVASKIPADLQNFILKSLPNTDFRFDGMIILPDNTIYLPLFPAKPEQTDNIQVNKTFPSGKTLAQKPEIVIFNNNYVILKVIDDRNGKKTIFVPTPIPDEIRNGLLPQDMLVPRGLTIPESIKGIIGNLNIETSKNQGLRVEVPKSLYDKNNTVTPAPQLKNKTFYVATGYSKNIQVINTDSKTPAYALSQDYTPNNMIAYDNKFLLVTSFGSKTLNVISLADEEIIKQIYLTTTPDEILIDSSKKIAYVSSPENSSIYVVNLETMTLSKQIKINGMCERLMLTNDGSKLFYCDKKNNEIWAVELNNNYLLKDIGKFPNVSKIEFNNNKIYITSRTKNHLAIIDYETNGLIAEIEITPKPVDMISFENNLYILGALENSLQIIDTKTDEITDSIYLNTNGFSTNIDPIDGTSLAIISDSRTTIYCVLDMKTKKIIKANAIEVPIRSIVITDRVKKINK